MAQMGFFALSDRYASLDAKQDPLVGINAVVPWDAFRPLPERVWRKPDEARKSRAGRRPMDAVLMFKTLVLSRFATCPTIGPGIRSATGSRPGRFLGPWSRGPGT